MSIKRLFRAAQAKIKFSVKDFFSKYEQILIKQQKSLTENLICCPASVDYKRDLIFQGIAIYPSEKGCKLNVFCRFSLHIVSRGYNVISMFVYREKWFQEQRERFQQCFI